MWFCVNFKKHKMIHHFTPKKVLAPAYEGGEKNGIV